MLYNAFDTKFSKITKQLIFWVSLFSMIGLFLFLFNAESTLPQRQIVLDVDIKDKINICAPQEQEQRGNRKLYDF